MIKDLHASTEHHFSARDREIWLGGPDDLLLYGAGDFPPLPEFPCMSSSSSTSSTPAPVKPVELPTSSSASSASWAVLKSDVEEDHDHDHHQAVDVGSTQAAALCSTASMECMDVMENLEYMDLMTESSNEFFDPSSLFQQDYPLEDFQVPDLKLHQNEVQEYPRENFGSGPYVHGTQEHDQFLMIPTNNYDNTTTESADRDSGDLGSVFLEWLKSNKEIVCADDLRKVKIKKATIECAAKRLGGGREGMKQLLKLILEWVQSNHLHKRRAEDATSNIFPFQNPNTIPQEQNSFPWSTLEPPGYNPAMAPPCNYPYPAVAPAQDYHMVDSSQFALHAPAYSSFPDHVAGFGNQCFQGSGESKLVRLGSSATKEARKKRMARQRRLFAHHRSHHHHHHQTNYQGADQQHARDGIDNCTTNQGNWMYHWLSGATGLADGQKVNLDRQSKQNSSNDRRQGWKPEKNLRFLLQKVLKQSDVGNLGRIVLPKKEAETHLPELEARDGIAISMEDIGTSRVWNMRYRFWPNNKSRMYLLENTGDFVRTNGLQEGDFIVIYSDVKCGKYLIRGVKVRQPGPKPEAKRPAKSQRNQQAASPAGNGSSSSPVTQTTK